jgi:hypothetical protein
MQSAMKIPSRARLHAYIKCARAPWATGIATAACLSTGCSHTTRSRIFVNMTFTTGLQKRPKNTNVCGIIFSRIFSRIFPFPRASRQKAPRKEPWLPSESSRQLAPPSVGVLPGAPRAAVRRARVRPPCPDDDSSGAVQSRATASAAPAAQRRPGTTV